MHHIAIADGMHHIAIADGMHHIGIADGMHHIAIADGMHHIAIADGMHRVAIADEMLPRHERMGLAHMPTHTSTRTANTSPPESLVTASSTKS